ncbi:hypothetical protein [Lysinibacillus sp. Y5S-8]|uniref:hypothetical protein n=1 Tax=Lysinibacillus sp. Y5S-8 TaxID=3122488 RepID=UPI00115035DA
MTDNNKVWAPIIISKADEILSNALKESQANDSSVKAYTFERQHLENLLIEAFSNERIPSGAMIGALNRILSSNPKIRKIKRGLYNYMPEGDNFKDIAEVIEKINKFIEELEENATQSVTTENTTLDLKDIRMIWSIQETIDTLEDLKKRIIDKTEEQ